jgi:rhodanese-related sulfurtransferase
MDDWRAAGRPVASVPQLDARALAARLAAGDRLLVVDVRRPAEYDAGHIPGARNIPVTELAAGIDELAGGIPVVVACAGGYRSAAAAGILERSGVLVAGDLAGGVSAWIAAGLPLDRARSEAAA